MVKTDLPDDFSGAGRERIVRQREGAFTGLLPDGALAGSTLPTAVLVPDEVAMPADTQHQAAAACLQGENSRPVGYSKTEMKVDVRYRGTNRDLPKKRIMRPGRFRADLFYD